MPLISVVINLDSRNQNDKADTMFNGTVSWDYWIDGVLNKVKFFDGFDKEIIVYGDVHNEIPIEILSKLQSIADTVCLRKHTEEANFNDKNYLRALSLASGDKIIHFDGDTMAFTSSKDAAEEYIALLDNHTVVSYPHWFSPNPDVNHNYDYWWASTRCFMCKREFLDIPEIEKGLKDNNYFYSKYPASIINPWTEHLLGLLAKYRGNGVYYPPLDENKILIFSWATYKTGTIKQLNELSYEKIVEWVKEHPIHFPNDITI